MKQRVSILHVVTSTVSARYTCVKWESDSLARHGMALKSTDRCTGSLVVPPSQVWQREITLTPQRRQACYGPNKPRELPKDLGILVVPNPMRYEVSEVLYCTRPCFSGVGFELSMRFRFFRWVQVQVRARKSVSPSKSSYARATASFLAAAVHKTTP